MHTIALHAFIHREIVFAIQIQGGRNDEVSRDDELGDYIAISEGEDVEINIYGLGKIDVERGQPLKQGQKLGEAAGERLVIKVYRDGRPEDVSSVFELEKKA